METVDRGVRRVGLAAAALAAALGGATLAPSVAHAHGDAQAQAQGQGRRHAPSHRVGAADYVLTGVSTTGLVLGAVFLEPYPTPVRWRGPILFDDDVRRAVALRDPNARDGASTASWVLFGAVVGYPVLVDIPYAIARGRSDLAWQFAWENALVVTTATAAYIGLRHVAGRTRPEAEGCLPGDRGQCEVTPGEVPSARSFPGGHFMVTSASAALTCTQHLNTRLYGGGGDAAVCGAAIAANIAVGVLRMNADMHWLSDTVAGGVIGSLIGWGLPTLLHYRGASPRVERDGRGATAAARGPVVVPLPMVSSRSASLALTGMF